MKQNKHTQREREKGAKKVGGRRRENTKQSIRERFMRDFIPGKKEAKKRKV